MLFIFILIGLNHPIYAETTHPVAKSKKTLKKTAKKTTAVKTSQHRKKITPKKTKKKKKIIRTYQPQTASICAPIKSNITKSLLPDYSLSSSEKNIVTEVRRSISNLSYATYKLGGSKIDPARGVYVVDCSTYVDHILKSTVPDAYSDLINYTGVYKPTSSDFYQYFQNLSESDESNWNTIENVKNLRPGDIIVFRYKPKMSRGRPGHVMIVMDKPVRQDDVYYVRVADSAPSGHSSDTRQPRASGIGIGTLLLKVHPYSTTPYAYAWKVGARWEQNVNFAMARPLDFNS